eukprot:Skav217958  [mRNA]  locus=scaffold3450:29789:38377:+ [translate_table: standard]
MLDRIIPPYAQFWQNYANAGNLTSAYTFQPSKEQLLECAAAGETVLHAPSHRLTQLTDHGDEVLFVVFSPCGTRLASCSRDLQTIIFKVHYPNDGEHCGEGPATEMQGPDGKPPKWKFGSSGLSDSPSRVMAATEIRRQVTQHLLLCPM